jgi:hypothetical protein
MNFAHERTATVRPLEGRYGPWMLLVLLVGLDVLFRIAPHAPNVTPLAATALLAGALMRSRILALCVPLAAMAAGDLLLGGYDARLMAVVYGALLVPALFGGLARVRRNGLWAVPLAAASSAIFYLSTNFAVWLFTDVYPRSAEGLVACYIAALPFLRNSMLGDLGWTLALFGTYWALSKALGSPTRRQGGAPSQAPRSAFEMGTSS